MCFAITVALIGRMRGAAPAMALAFLLLSVPSCSCVVTEFAGKHRGADEIHSIARSNLKLARQKHNSSHSRLEVLFYYDSVDQYTLGTMNDDRLLDDCVKGPIGLSRNEVAL